MIIHILEKSIVDNLKPCPKDVFIELEITIIINRINAPRNPGYRNVFIM
jgi:hypothetical protein